MYELWLDGNNAGSFDWTGVVNLAHKLAPHLLVWTGDNIRAQTSGGSGAKTVKPVNYVKHLDRPRWQESLVPARVGRVGSIA